MKKNVGNLDRIIRVVLGLSLIAFAVITKNWWGFIGIVPIMTAMMSYCPVYGLLRVSTKTKIKTEKLNL
jgi:Inner membrane protein YgaP-like, transmembrane domain